MNERKSCLNCNFKLFFVVRSSRCGAILNDCTGQVIKSGPQNDSSEENECDARSTVMSTFYMWGAMLNMTRNKTERVRNLSYCKKSLFAWAKPAQLTAQRWLSSGHRCGSFEMVSMNLNGNGIFRNDFVFTLCDGMDFVWNGNQANQLIDNYHWNQVCCQAHNNLLISKQRRQTNKCKWHFVYVTSVKSIAANGVAMMQMRATIFSCIGQSTFCDLIVIEIAVDAKW